MGFLRERLALLGKTVFLLSFGFYVFLTASVVLVGGAPFTAVMLTPVGLGHFFEKLHLTLNTILVLMRRFEREARATDALKSPHTVQLYDFGATDDGTLCIEMP